MANSSREALLHSAMDQLVSRVRKWKAGSGVVGHSQAQDLCHQHKDDIYKCFQESGLQAWEFHTMLHRAAEYGLVEDMKGLWSEVATTFLQMRSGYGSSFEVAAAQQQHKPQFNQTQQQQQALPGPKANGVYSSSNSSSAPHTVNGRSNNSKPPGLGRPAQQAFAYAAAPNRGSQDDISSTSTDQHSSRKQQQKSAGRGSTAAASKGSAAAAAGVQQQQGRNGNSNAAANAAPAAAAAASSNSSKPAAASSGSGALSSTAAAAGDLALPNGYISAWRNGLDAPGASKPHSLMTGFMAGPGFQQQLTQQQQQQQQPPEPLQQGLGMDQQQQEEPLDLLPLGLLDDVYDQGDAVVDGPPKSKAAAAAAGTVAGRAAGGKQQQQQGKQQSNKQQRQQGRAAQQKQQSSQQQQQQQSGGSRGAAAAPSGSQASPQRPAEPPPQQQQQELTGFESAAAGGPLSPAARPFPSPLALGSFGAQQQQQQANQLGYDITSPLAGLQQRASLEALHQQQQQLLFMQQQARYYQQQQHLGVWGAAPHIPYVHPLAAAGLPMQPPPPPRNVAATAAGGSGSNAAPAGLAGAGAGQPGAAVTSQEQQQQPVKPGYAAVAAGLTAGGGSNGGLQGGGSSESSSTRGEISLASGGMSYRGSLGLSAAPGGPVSSTTAAPPAADNRPASAQHAHIQQQQQQQSSLPEVLLQQQQQQQQGLLGLQQQQPPVPIGSNGSSGGACSKGMMPAGLSLFQGASYDSPLNGPLLAGSSSSGTAVGAGPLSPFPSPMHRSLSGVQSAGASPAFASLAATGPQGSSSSLGMAPMLLPPSALGAIGEPVGGSSSSSSHATQQQQQQHASAAAAAAPGPAKGNAWGVPGRVQQGVPEDAVGGSKQQQLGMPTSQQQQQQDSQLQIGSLGSLGSGRGIVADSSSSSASSSVAAPAAASVATSPHSMSDCSPSALARTHPQQQQQQQAAESAAAVRETAPQQQQQQQAEAQQQQQGQPAQQPATPPSQQQQQLGQAHVSSSPAKQQQQAAASPSKPLTWAQKLKKAEGSSSTAAPNGPGAAAAASGSSNWGAGSPSPHPLLPSGGSSSSSGPRIAPAPKSELTAAAAAAAGGSSGGSSRHQHRSTGQALLAAARQQEEAAAAAAAAAVPTYSEEAALEGLDETTAKAAVTAASRMPLPAKLIQAWRSRMCLGSLIKLLQSQRQDLATAVNDRIKGWLCQDCDRSTAECLVLFVLANLRRDWHMTAKNPGAFLMGLLQHRAALIGGSGLSRKLLETARNFPNVAVYIDSDVLQELGDMDPELRCFVMDEYMCKQRHDWPEGLKFPSQCLLSCMRSIRYADPAVHRAYMALLSSRPDLSKACNGVILYGLCKCDRATGLAAVRRLSELPEAWTSAARVNASAFLYQKVQELCGGHGCY